MPGGLDVADDQPALHRWQAGQGAAPLPPRALALLDERRAGTCARCAVDPGDLHRDPAQPGRGEQARAPIQAAARGVTRAHRVTLTVPSRPATDEA